MPATAFNGHILLLLVMQYMCAVQASQQPLCDIPNPLMNALASFVASVSEEALAKLVVPLTVAVVQQTAAAATVSAVPGKGKAGLLVMTAVIARTRPQVRPALLSAVAAARVSSAFCKPR